MSHSGMGQAFVSRRGVIVAVVLAFACLLLFTIVKHPSFQEQEEFDSQEDLVDSTLSEKAAELPHDPAVPADAEATSFTEQAAVVVSGMVASTPKSLFDFKARLLKDGQEVNFGEFKGMVSLVVNVASQCGYTDTNYKELQEMYSKYESQGFVVLAFPCNQFGAQEPGTPQEIEKFAREKYHVTFPLFEKVDVNGPNSHPLFAFLKEKFGMKEIPWNFQKFVISRDGLPVHQYPSQIDPFAMEGDIAKLLDA
eukprot:CAMPEP_0181300584 /NCGR_PEP_ID=MMETSP1101-20121128/6966_1 /TAXON_ID=46948 /ORGANISM="Rhodomonas abbreviata, Strain Caron Lab Isolate" /LENGTH=251 /DNA_ID=CAMNT_0023405827 /DNA_START=312 /DNA_END=1067 /DNA_ORIENTATION=+